VEIAEEKREETGFLWRGKERRPKKPARNREEGKKLAGKKEDEDRCPLFGGDRKNSRRS